MTTTDLERQVREEIAREGLVPTEVHLGPCTADSWHASERPTVLYVLQGSAMIHTAEGDHRVEAGDRLEIAAGVSHCASPGRDGVTCIEAVRPE